MVFGTVQLTTSAGRKLQRAASTKDYFRITLMTAHKMNSDEDGGPLLHRHHSGPSCMSLRRTFSTAITYHSWGGCEWCQQQSESVCDDPLQVPPWPGPAWHLSFDEIGPAGLTEHVNCNREKNDNTVGIGWNLAPLQNPPVHKAEANINTWFQEHFYRKKLWSSPQDCPLLVLLQLLSLYHSRNSIC